MKFAIIPVLFFLSVFQVSADSSKPVAGDYIETRSNHVYTCGCLYSGEMVTGGREAILAWKIQTGEYSGTALQDTRIVAVIVGDDTLSTENNPRRTALYLDGVSSNRQRDAAVRWVQDQYSEILGDVVAVRNTKIAFHQEAGSSSVDVKDVLRLEARPTQLPEDAHQGSLRWYEPFVPLDSHELSTVVHEEYSGTDFPRSWKQFRPRISGFSGKFILP